MAWNTGRHSVGNRGASNGANQKTWNLQDGEPVSAKKALKLLIVKDFVVFTNNYLTSIHLAFTLSSSRKDGEPLGPVVVRPCRTGNS